MKRLFRNQPTHIRTKPYTPLTNGKAERIIQTVLREWAYATAFETSEQRKAELPIWLHRYNWHRPHASIANKPPVSRILSMRTTTCKFTVSARASRAGGWWARDQHSARKVT
jgi:transposase InsO family protein